MATQWVLDKISGALAPTVSGAVASAGSYAGGAVNAVGNTINGVGDGFGRAVRSYGDGVKDYGNGLMDWTKAEGPRAATASNPLGLSSGSTGGKRQVTSGSIYRPPVEPSKTLMTTSKSTTPQKKVGGGTPQKALSAPSGAKAVNGVKKTISSAPVKKPPTTPLKPVQNTAKTSTSPNPGAMRKPAGAATSKPNGAAKAGAVKKPAAKPATTKPKTNLPGANPTAGANPLGLTW
jgi:hypothetical protein